VVFHPVKIKPRSFVDPLAVKELNSIEAAAAVSVVVAISNIFPDAAGAAAQESPLDALDWAYTICPLDPDGSLTTEEPLFTRRSPFEVRMLSFSEVFEYDILFNSVDRN
jgi:hypothetical protein